jgi:hypothetical protein
MLDEAAQAAFRPIHPAFRPFRPDRTAGRLTAVPDEPVAAKNTIHDESKTYRRSVQQFNSAESRGRLLSFQNDNLPCSTYTSRPRRWLNNGNKQDEKDHQTYKIR